MRNGARALELAKAITGNVGAASASAQDTLAAAFAETGDFPSAVRMAEQAIAKANDLTAQTLSDEDIKAILAFLEALEDPAERLGFPKTVPSGLPVDQ